VGGHRSHLHAKTIQPGSGGPGHWSQEGAPFGQAVSSKPFLWRELRGWQLIRRNCGSKARKKGRNAMSSIFYIIGVVVVVLIILSFLGLR
jgi:hypothetical protein